MTHYSYDRYHCRYLGGVHCCHGRYGCRYLTQLSGSHDQRAMLFLIQFLALALLLALAVAPVLCELFSWQHEECRAGELMRTRRAPRTGHAPCLSVRPCPGLGPFPSPCLCPCLRPCLRPCLCPFPSPCHCPCLGPIPPAFRRSPAIPPTCRRSPTQPPAPPPASRGWVAGGWGRQVMGGRRGGGVQSGILLLRLLCYVCMYVCGMGY